MTKDDNTTKDNEVDSPCAKPTTYGYTQYRSSNLSTNKTKGGKNIYEYHIKSYRQEKGQYLHTHSP